MWNIFSGKMCTCFKNKNVHLHSQIISHKQLVLSRVVSTNRLLFKPAPAAL